MKVVLDTNVVVSAFLSPAGKPANILGLVLRGDVKAYFNTAILAEYEEVLCRSKFVGRIPPSSVARFFELLRDTGHDVDSIPSLIPMPDETDRKFYDTAKTSGAILVTGNKKHYPGESFILDPAEFLVRLASRQN